MRPCTVDIIDQGDVGVVELVAGDFVWVAVVVAAHLDHDEVGRLFGFVVELLGLVSEECVGTTARVGGAIPIPCLFDGLLVCSGGILVWLEAYHAVGVAAVALEICQACAGVGLFQSVSNDVLSRFRMVCLL